MNPIDILQDAEIPTHSYLAAIKHLNSFADKTLEQYKSAITDLTGIAYSTDDFRQTKYTYLYLVQELVRAHTKSIPISPEDVLECASTKAASFISGNSYVFAEPEDVYTDGDGIPKRKKGTKQDEALRIYKEHMNDGKEAKATIISLYQTELDMTKAGATTYFYSTRKKIADSQAQC